MTLVAVLVPGLLAIGLVIDEDVALVIGEPYPDGCPRHWDPS